MEIPTPYTLEASYAPQIDGEETRRHIENACAQRTFWTAAQELLNTGQSDKAVGPVLQICLIAEPQDKQTRLTINLRNLSPDSEAVQTFKRALPPGYGWKESNSASFFLSGDGFLSKSWHVARIERRLNFVDLPWRRLDTLESTGVHAAKPASANAASWSSRDWDKRRLLTRFMTDAELESERYCIPVSGALEIDPRSLRVLFQELRLQSPCIVSAAIAPVDADRLDSYRRIAMFWSAHLQPFGPAIANAGFANLANLYAQYGRFLMPDRFLCVVALRVAASTSAAARAVALHLTGRLGGSRSFVVRDPVVAPLESLREPWNDIPHREKWNNERWRRRRERLHRELSADGIECGEFEEVFGEFLIELPHLYTIDEVSAAAGLPVANEEGLPGFVTRLIAPFSEPSSAGAFSTAQPPPKDRIRVGIAPSSNAFALTDGTTAVAGDWHTIAPSDLTKHAFVVGSTGSGKTVTTLFLVRELIRLKIPFLIVEPVKTEYFDQLKHIQNLSLRRYRLEGTSEGMQTEDFLAFDPMRLQDGVSVARHASYLKSCFEAAFPLEPVAALILDSGLRNYYTDKPVNFGCGLGLFTRGCASIHRDVHYLNKKQTSKDGKEKLLRDVASADAPDGKAQGEIVQSWNLIHPSLAGFREYFLKTFLPRIVQAKSGQDKLNELLEQWRQLFERRFDALSSSMIGVAARKADHLFRKNLAACDPFSELLKGPTILELDGVPDDEHKALLMAFVMTFLFERRQADDLIERERQASDRPQAARDDLKHVLFVEEAHRILANASRNGRGELAGAGAQAKSVSLFVDMLAEIRAFGQGLVIIEQIPTKIVPEAVKNTNLKIMLRLTAADDREFLGTAMNFTDEQKRFVTSLRAESGRGVDMVVFEQQLDQPRLLTLPLPTKRAPTIHASLFLDRGLGDDIE